MRFYVAGFMFNATLTKVALIRKNSPEWQKGLLNGIGGKLEPSDRSNIQAMQREFQEETGFFQMDWTYYARLHEGGRFSVGFYCCVGDLTKLKSTTDEKVEIIPVSKIKNHQTIENIPWLVELAIDCLRDGRPTFADVLYPNMREDG